MNSPNERKGSSSKRRRRGGRGGRNRPQGQGAERNRHGGGSRGRRGNDRPRNSLVDAVPSGEPSIDVRGVLQLSQQGHGHLRSPEADY